jgi:hypothetical protein
MVVFQPFGQSPLRSTTFVATACTAAPRTTSIHPAEGLNNIAAGMRKVSGSDYVAFSPLARVLVTRVVHHSAGTGGRSSFNRASRLTCTHPRTAGPPAPWPMVPAMRHRARRRPRLAGTGAPPGGDDSDGTYARTAALEVARLSSRLGDGGTGGAAHPTRPGTHREGESNGKAADPFAFRTGRL